MRHILLAALTVVSIFSHAQTIAHVAGPGKLSQVLTQLQQDTCTQLKVVGALNSADIRLLRQMGGYQEDTGMTGVLSHLDLSEATFVTDKTPYMVLDARKERLAATAVPGRISSSESVLGMSALEKSGIDHTRYENMYWQGKSYFDKSNYMLTRTKNVSYYTPKMYLGRSSERPMQVTSDVYYGTDRTDGQGWFTSAFNRGQYFFDENVSQKRWKEMKRRKLTRFGGHKLIKADDGYRLCVHSKKKLFPHDMFYKCMKLQTVIIPEGMCVNYTITDETTQTKYQTGSGIKITYFDKSFKHSFAYPPASMGVVSSQKTMRLYGSHISGSCSDGVTQKELAYILGRLTPMPMDRKYKMDTRAKFLIESIDGRPEEVYYIDMDNEHVLKESSGEYYKASQELIEAMRILKII